MFFIMRWFSSQLFVRHFPYAELYEKVRCMGNVVSYSSLNLSDVERCVVLVRGKRVIIDHDVAALYNVETKRVNEAVKNNPEKFPAGYVIELTSED